MKRADDEEQLEYICQWSDMKEEEKQEKLHRKYMKKFYLTRAKWYLKKAFEDLMQGILG